MKNIRENLTNEKIRSYHKAFYRPENLVLIITGPVKAEDVFEALRPIEEAIVLENSKGKIPPFTRPWQNPVPPLLSSVDQMVLYPCEEEDKGLVYLAWRGPSSIYQLYEMSALMMLMEYLVRKKNQL